VSASEFTQQQLIGILRAGAGTPEGVDLEGEILDVPFEELGYESLALLETVGRIERSYGVSLGEELPEGLTPRLLLEQVNGRIDRAVA
jgi:act minimal PKS acyl carrier protein